MYSYEASNQFFSRLSALESVDKKFFNENYEFTILGKGWKVKVDELRKSGIKVQLIEFVPNYIEEIIKYDIQPFFGCIVNVHTIIKSLSESLSM